MGSTIHGVVVFALYSSWASSWKHKKLYIARSCSPKIATQYKNTLQSWVFAGLVGCGYLLHKLKKKCKAVA